MCIKAWFTKKSSMCKKITFLACVNCCSPPKANQIAVWCPPAEDLLSNQCLVIVLGCIHEYFKVCWSWALNAFIHRPLYKWSKERLLDLVCNKSSAFRSAELETIIEILVPRVQIRKLESSIPPVGQMPLEFHELLGTSDRAGRGIPVFVSCTVCLYGAWLWRHCFLLQVK